MAATFTDMAAFALHWAWFCLSTAHAHMTTRLINELLHSQDAFQEVFISLGLVFAPGLLEALQSSTPPTIAFFRSLPKHTDVGPCWAVYLILLGKLGCLPKIYVGLSTNELQGVSARMSDYECGNSLPKWVKAALDDGFNITRKGLLCWCPMPAFDVLLSPLRALFLVLEATFTLMLWAMHSRTSDYFSPALCPWPKADLDYDGCCSHVSLSDPVSGSHRMRDNPDLQRERREANIAMQRYRCHTCNLNFGAHNQLEHHMTLDVHKNKVAGITKIIKQPHKRILHAQNKASKRFYCAICNYPAPNQQKLTIHNGTEKHRNKVAKAAAAAAEVVETCE